MKNNFDEIAQIEKAIREKYGEEAIQNPKRNWTKEKEEEFLKDLKLFYRRATTKKDDIEEKKGFKIIKKASTIKTEMECPVCSAFSFSLRDDLYMNKYGCCQECFFQYIDGREDRWLSGWRPNNN